MQAKLNTGASVMFSRRADVEGLTLGIVVPPRPTEDNCVLTGVGLGAGFADGGPLKDLAVVKLFFLSVFREVHSDAWVPYIILQKEARHINGVSEGHMPLLPVPVRVPRSPVNKGEALWVCLCLCLCLCLRLCL